MRFLLNLLVLTTIGLAGMSLLQERQEASSEASPCDADLDDCGQDNPWEGLAEAQTMVLAAQEVCPRSGYLCAGFSDRGNWRVLRWVDDTPEIRVRLPRPEVDDAMVALRLQQAAARGILAWQGHPLPIRIDLTNQPGDHDFVVEWRETLGGRELGEARTEWRSEGGRMAFRVVEFNLAIRNPFRPQEFLSRRQIELTAAHEMGHALGLPHSDQERDVMYAKNTATSLTVRDYRTMEALYALENGAEIGDPAAGG